MSGYFRELYFRRNETMSFGIGESPASHRRTVRSSRSKTLRANARVERPERSIAYRRSSTAGQSRRIAGAACLTNTRDLRVLCAEFSDLATPSALRLAAVAERNALRAASVRRSVYEASSHGIKYSGHMSAMQGPVLAALTDEEAE